ncbi:lipopolysaccharide biosynthesis protein [Novosphingobium sp. Leaf2]|uniref:lipopolysaccharide biosynthesis protein n=1 Tax=Novosphingobium sp. Leaf2 TaxID=1735670 RepID=UPI0006F61ECD|nr:lipopolysaccharide biosynthesis protein [Novosphingobium sp. Leaf2]KQM13776.1 hypothetical protein ASE49_11970 [Novosphingobium sp. Leaf2]
MSTARPGIASPLLWSTASSLGTQALAFATFAVLARLLGAPAFGLVALAALVIDLLLVVSNAGIAEAVVQRPALSEDDADTAFWTNLLCGLFFCIATMAFAPLIAGAFDQPKLTSIIRALATIFVINPLGAIHTARLTRSLNFHAVAMRNIVAALVGAGVGLPLALAGYGIWSLVAQRIAVIIALSACAWISLPWLPRLRFRYHAFRELVRFGAYIGLSGTLNQINIRIAEVISGALVGPVAVAFIRAGSRIVEVLNQVTYAPFHQIAMPLLARSCANNEELKATYLRLSRLSAFVMFPAFLGCMALADVVVAVVFGPGWEAVADAIRIFACAVAAAQMNNLIVSAITALGHSGKVLSWTATQITLGLLAAWAVHKWGWQAMLMTGVARGYLILPYGFYLLKKHAGIRFRDVIASVRPALCSAAVMAIAVIGGVTKTAGILHNAFTVVLWGTCGAGIYLGVYVLQDREIIVQMRDILASRRKITRVGH